jgi:hypothetical protein
MLQNCATARRLWLLHASENAVSARVKITPPWQVSCPLSIASVTVKATTARPAAISSSVASRPRLTRSPPNIAAAQAAAIASSPKGDRDGEVGGACQASGGFIN